MPCYSIVIRQHLRASSTVSPNLSAGLQCGEMCRWCRWVRPLSAPYRSPLGTRGTLDLPCVIRRPALQLRKSAQQWRFYTTTNL